MITTPSRRDPERGVALLIVLVVLFIIAVLMVDITLTATTARRSARNASNEFLMDAGIDGWFMVMTSHLAYDAAENKFDSPDDRWADTDFSHSASLTAAGEEGAPAAPEDEESSLVAVGDSDDFPVECTCVPENAKFNLYLLMHPDAKQREAARERFAVLIDRFREDSPLDISRTKAEEIRDRIVEYLERAAPGEGEAGKLPVPKAGPWRILTPDELRCVEGLEDSSHGLGAEGVLYAAADPAAVREYELDPDNVEKPEKQPGLLRFVTLWSGSAWIGQAAPDTWIPVNINFAEKPVLETLFYRNPSDFMFADRIIEYRGAAREASEQPSPSSSSDDEPKELHQFFEKIEDIKKVDGLDDGVIQRNSLTPATITVQSDTFSLYMWVERKSPAKQEEEDSDSKPVEPAYKQVRFVVRRNNQGVQTLLREERADAAEDVKGAAPAEGE